VATIEQGMRELEHRGSMSAAARRNPSLPEMGHPVCVGGSDRGVHPMPVARAAFFATRLSPAPVLRIVRFAVFTTFFVLDFLRLAILFPPVPYLVGPSPRLWI
jgi:hypothetical protein